MQSCEGRSGLTETLTSPAVNSPGCHTSSSVKLSHLGSSRLERSIDEHDHA